MDERKDIVIERELDASYWEIVTRTNSGLECFKILLIDADSTRSSEHALIFYNSFLKLKTLRDSMDAVVVNHRPTREEWMDVLLKFRKKAGDIKGTERSEAEIDKDIKFLQENINRLPDTRYGMVYRHILARWAMETYRSYLSNWCIDFPRGYNPPCSL